MRVGMLSRMARGSDLSRGTSGSPRDASAPGTKGAPTPDAGRPQAGKPGPLADWIPRVLEEMGLQSVNDGARLRSAWSRAVGPEIAAHSHPQGIRRGVVHATVPDSAWMQRLQMEKVRVLASLRGELGDDRVLDLRLRIAARR